MSISFKKGNGTPKALVPINGTVKYGDGHDIRGGGGTPHLKAGIARNGSCLVALDDEAFTVTDAKALASGKGAGDYTVSGDSIKTGMESNIALVDVTIKADSVMVADISWKGTIA